MWSPMEASFRRFVSLEDARGRENPKAAAAAPGIIPPDEWERKPPPIPRPEVRPSRLECRRLAKALQPKTLDS